MNRNPNHMSPIANILSQSFFEKTPSSDRRPGVLPPFPPGAVTSMRRACPSQSRLLPFLEPSSTFPISDEAQGRGLALSDTSAFRNEGSDSG